MVPMEGTLCRNCLWRLLGESPGPAEQVVATERQGNGTLIAKATRCLVEGRITTNLSIDSQTQ